MVAVVAYPARFSSSFPSFPHLLLLLPVSLSIPKAFAEAANGTDDEHTLSGPRQLAHDRSYIATSPFPVAQPLLPTQPFFHQLLLNSSV